MLLAAAPAAHADEQISAAPPNRYVNADVTIDQGERVTFANGDTVDHDVTARDKGPDGKALFASPLIGTGVTAPVSGTEYLTTGAYAFFCSIHPQMVGTLRVNSAGAPVPRPPGGGGGPPDRSAPIVGLKLLDGKLSAVRRRGAIRLRLTVDEAAKVGLTLRAGKKALGSRTVSPAGAAASTVSVKLTRAGKRIAARSRSLRVTLSANARDGAGTVGTKTVSRPLR